MKKIIFTLTVLFVTLALSAQEITGTWNGQLAVQGIKLRLVFHVTKTDAGYSATMDSPDQGAKDIPMTSAKFENNVLTLELQSAQIVYTATFVNNDSITGNFVQAGMTLPLGMSRKAIEKTEKVRPQNPVKPYPYYSEEVTFLNPVAKITLAGTLTLPKKEGKFPVVVMITGSGPQNRDEELMGHKPFLVISDYLTRNGIGVLRYDDRGCFESKGNFSKATTNDLATDVEAAVNYLKTRKDIDKKAIGLIGHSEGGIIAPIVAVADKDIRFIVLMAGTAIPGSELLILQQNLIGKASGIPEDKLKDIAEINKGAFKIIEEHKDTTIIAKELKNYLIQAAKRSPDVQNTDSVTLDKMVSAQVVQITSPWMMNFIKYNPEPTLEKVKCAVLAINGSNDLQVPANVNLPAIENALKKGGNKNYTVKELPGLNHLFQECTTGLPSEYSTIEQTISPVALKTMLNWIKGTLKMK